MTNQEQQAEEEYKKANADNKDAQHATQIAQKATDELEDVQEGAEEGDLEDTALEGLEDL